MMLGFLDLPDEVNMLIVEDRDIEAMVEKLADRHGSSPVEALRLVLRQALVSDTETLAERSRTYVQVLRARSPEFDPTAADRAFIDSLYDD
jgi:hypothetical protein